MHWRLRSSRYSRANELRVIGPWFEPKAERVQHQNSFWFDLCTAVRRGRQNDCRGQQSCADPREKTSQRQGYPPGTHRHPTRSLIAGEAIAAKLGGQNLENPRFPALPVSHTNLVRPARAVPRGFRAGVAGKLRLLAGADRARSSLCCRRDSDPGRAAPRWRAAAFPSPEEFACFEKDI